MKFTPEQLHMEWQAGFYGPLDAKATYGKLTYDAIFGKPQESFDAAYAMADYIDYLREELRYRDHLQGQTREFLGIDRYEALA